jgi:arylsulfatase A-like enzyme
VTNFIYFNPDEMRADLLGCYGHPLARTPNFDRLAASGVRFDQCHVQHTVCTPSRCSFMTGWYPHTHGHRTLWHSLRNDEPNTLKYLKQSGYDVRWIGKNDLLAPDSFEDSVTKIHFPKGGAGGANLYERDDARFMNFLRGPLDGDNNDYHRAQEGVRYLKNRKPGDPPFMLYIPIGCPHCPYTVPEPWYSMYDPNDLPPLRQTEPDGKPQYVHWIRKYRRLDEQDDAELRKIMAVYMGMISYVDHMLGLLLDALEETGQDDNTAVFFFSDHGDWAGDYGLVEKWPSGLDDCLTRIPMIVRAPGNQAGHVVNEPIECFDIMPTTLELAGVDVQHTHHGRSMGPQLRGSAGDPGRAVFAEGGYGPHEPHCFEGKPSDGVASDPDAIYYPKAMQQQDRRETVCRSTMIRTATHKLVRRPDDVDELYDLVADPQECRNVYNCPEYAQIQQELIERMLDWYIQTSDVTPFETDPRGFNGAPEHLTVRE